MTELTHHGLIQRLDEELHVLHQNRCKSKGWHYETKNIIYNRSLLLLFFSFCLCVGSSLEQVNVNANLTGSAVYLCNSYVHAECNNSYYLK